jgi:hypothetical protein
MLLNTSNSTLNKPFYILLPEAVFYISSTSKTMYLLTGNGIIALVDDETTEESEDDVHHDSEEEDTK